MTSTISLETLMAQGGQTPYTKSLKVKVVANDPEFQYRNDKNELKTLVNCILADDTMAVKCTVYVSSKFQRFREGESLIVRNVIKKAQSVVVTSTSKVFPTGDVYVPEHIAEVGRHILNPPPAAVKTVYDALASPPRIRVSIKGKVTQEEAVKEVNVKQELVKVKNIFIEDQTSKCKVALWRSCASEDVRPGDYVHITDVVTNFFRNETSLSTTTKTRIVKTECPTETAVYNAISACIEGEEVTLLLPEDNILSVPLELVEMALPGVERNNIESHLISRCNPSFPVRCTSKGSSITSLEIL